MRIDGGMREFAEWIQELQLIDVPLHGIKFTWGRLQSQSRIDRCVCNDEWLVNFPELKLIGLKKSFSDHNPLLLSLESHTN